MLWQWFSHCPSPLRRLRGSQAGDADASVPYTQSRNLAQGLEEVIGENNVRFGVIEGADHMDGLFYTEENLSAVFAWLDEVLK